MSFQKPHNYGIPPKENPLDTNPLTLKLPQGLRSRVRLIPNWQDELREAIAAWVELRSRVRLIPNWQAELREVIAAWVESKNV